MKNIKNVTSIFVATAIAGLVLASINAGAVGSPTTKKQLDTCTVTSGGHITEIGNTCSGTGDGCVPNPC